MNKTYLVCFKEVNNKMYPYDRLTHILHPEEYSHVGLSFTGLVEDSSIIYYASRIEEGVSIYTEPAEYLDLYEITLRPDFQDIIREYYEKYKGFECSFLKNIGYGFLEKAIPLTPREHDWFYKFGSAEWVARVLNLGFAEQYTIPKLIQFANEEDDV